MLLLGSFIALYHIIFKKCGFISNCDIKFSGGKFVGVDLPGDPNDERFGFAFGYKLSTVGVEPSFAAKCIFTLSNQTAKRLSQFAMQICSRWIQMQRLSAKTKGGSFEPPFVFGGEGGI